MEQEKIGKYVSVLGILMFLGVLAIKFSSTGPSDEFLGLTNPAGTYGWLFWSGLVTSALIALFGWSAQR